MPGNRRAAKARLEAVEKRLGERNLRQQHKRLTAIAKGLCDGLEINFSFARSRDAIQQNRLKMALVNMVDELKAAV